MSGRRIVEALGGSWREDRGLAHCPAHDDQNPSLSVRELPGGKVLVHCFAGCSQEAVIAALKQRRLWPTRKRR